MSLSYIAKTYGVPAKRGQRVRYTGDRGPKGGAREGMITSASGAHLNIRMDGDSFSQPYHPTWELEYLKDELLPVVEVTQADRDIADEYNRTFPELRLYEAFARHRTEVARLTEQRVVERIVAWLRKQDGYSCVCSTVYADVIERGELQHDVPSC